MRFAIRDLYQKNMNLLNFINEYPDENSCRDHFRQQREAEGIKCKKCGSTNHYWLQPKWQWQCRKCNFRTTLRSGTIMKNAKLPIRTWYLTMAFMSFTKKGMSACELQRQIGHKRYESIWHMMHKIREAMGKRDNLYTLEGMIEMDEAYFETATAASKKLKRGKGSQKQQNVAVFAESVPLEDIQTGRTSRHCRYFKMKVLQNHKSEGITDVVSRNIEQCSIMFTDKSTSYIDIADYVDVHITEKSTKQTTKTTLQWVHIAISNAKRTLLGIYHKIKGVYLQRYLDEFCYKLNRRYFNNNRFERLTIAVAKIYW